MKQIYMKSRKLLISLVMGACVMVVACRKTDYPSVKAPAYLRVFNDLTYNVTIANKDAPQPFLVMLIDPVVGDSGAPVSAGTTCDFLNTRGPLARPYPDGGNTALWQTEYPGTLKVAVGPIVNGFDLSGYAQVLSGKHHYMFVSRPRSNDPYYTLPSNLRKNVVVDTTIDLEQGEIYTMNVLEKDVYTRKVRAYVRHEQFTKTPFSDSLVYVNFYNLSDSGYYQTYVYPANGNGPFNGTLVDTAVIFYSLYKQQPGGAYGQVIKGFQDNYIGNLVRSQDPVVQPYRNFPLFPDTSSNHVYAGPAGQTFFFDVPGTSPQTVEKGTNSEQHGTFSSVAIGPMAGGGVYSIIGDVLTGMVITVRSGVYNPRSFATVNTIEYVNGNIYLTILQRRYDPPVY